MTSEGPLKVSVDNVNLTLSRGQLKKLSDTLQLKNQSFLIFIIVTNNEVVL